MKIGRELLFHFGLLGLAIVVPKPRLREFRLPTAVAPASSCVLLTTSFMLMQARSDSPFLYFQF